MAASKPPHATIETVTAWTCPHCGRIGMSFGAVNTLAGPPFEYRCYECMGFFLAPLAETTVE